MVSPRNSRRDVGRACPSPPCGAVGGSTQRERRHVRRLGEIFDTRRPPLFFLTVCVRHRQPVLADRVAFRILVGAWRDALSIHGWMVGRYVVLPDHVHFFATPATECAKQLSGFVGAWKQWTSRQIHESGLEKFAWQPEFFDHLMRGDDSYAQKWEYVRCNPVRAELVERADDWAYQGEIHSLSW